MKSKSPLETEEGKFLYKRVMLHPIARDFFYHIPNEGKRTKWGGHSLLMQGLRTGFPDYGLSYPKKGYHGLFIELKRIKPRGVVSLSQQTWLDKLNESGYLAKACWGWEDAWNFIESYLE